MLSFSLLRRHVRHRPQRRARTGQLLGAGAGRRFEPHPRTLRDLTADGRQFGEAEIQDLGVPSFGDKDIGGLDVAVHNAFAMRSIERIRDFDGQQEQLFIFQRTAGDDVFQCQAVQILHGDERPSLLLSDVVNGADIGMIQGGCRLSLALEAGQRLRITANVLRQKFKGHKAVQACVFGFVDHTHATATEFVGDSIVGDGLTDHRTDILTPF